MRSCHLAFVALLALALIFSACGKKEKVEKEQVETGEVTLTTENLNKFLKNFPFVMETMLAKREELMKYASDNPVESAQGAKAMEDVKKELLSKGINLEQFDQTYRKIIASMWFLSRKERLATVGTEQFVARLAELKSLVGNPGVPEEEKQHYREIIADMEAAKTEVLQMPDGLTQPEIDLVESRFPEINAVLSQGQESGTDEGGTRNEPAPGIK